MGTLRLFADRVELTPLPVPAAAALPADRDAAGRLLGARLSTEWPDPHLLGVLGRHVGARANTECFGVWVMIERSSATVVGDIGFRGPPDDAGAIELGYSVVPGCRGRGYATEAAATLVGWAMTQPDVRLIVAGCHPDNVPSVRTLERVGFRRTGRADGEIRWSYDRAVEPGERAGAAG